MLDMSIKAGDRKLDLRAIMESCMELSEDRGGFVIE